MTRIVGKVRRPASSTGRTPAGRFPQACGWFFPIVLELKSIFRTNCVPETACRAGRHVSVVEKWFAGKVSPDGEALARLLRSDIGDRLHDALIASVKSPWADNHRMTREIARLRQQQNDTARRLAALEGGIR